MMFVSSLEDNALKKAIISFCNKNPYGICFVLGCLLTLTQAPFHVIILFPCVFFVFLHITYTNVHSFKLGYVFGLGYFITLLHWVTFAFSHVGLSIIGGCLAVVALASYLSIWIGISVFLSKKLSASFNEFCFIFPLFWCLGEWIRGHFILGGFPWGLVGSMWNSLTILKLCSLTGIYGLSLISLFTVCLCFAKQWKTFLVFLCCYLYICIFYPKPNEIVGPTTNLRLIQPSIEHKWDPREQKRNMEIYQILSNAESNRSLHAILWPEAAFELGKYYPLPPQGLLISGVIHRLKDTIYNGIAVIDQVGTVNILYNKSHLVPFGEYIPFSWIPFNKLTHGKQDYSHGDGPKTIKIQGIPSFSPLVCYEAIFPGAVTGDKRPSWLLNVTNDVWYGDTVGPKQHAHMARIRSIEEGLPMVRVANNGISFVCDAYGKIIYSLSFNKVGYIDFELPKALSETLYAKFKDLLFLGVLGMLFLVVLTRKIHFFIRRI